jgi:PIN domain nuclease of toxin-antitoxin system
MGLPRETSLTVLDASAVVALLLDEPARGQVEAIMRRRPAPLISAVNLAETIDQLVRVRGRDAEQVNDAIDLLIVGGLEVQPFWLPDSRAAAAIRARFYHRTSAALSLADCVCLATAMSQRTDLATTDAVLADLARGLGVEVIELPSPSGGAS